MSFRNFAPFRGPLTFLAALLMLIVVGALFVARDTATKPEAKNMEFYWSLHYWQCTFDAISAACGAGLTTFEFDRDYTDAGRWTLTLIGVCGALLFVGAAARAEQNLGIASAAGWRAPVRAHLAAWTICACLSVAAALAWPRDASNAADTSSTAGSAEVQSNADNERATERIRLGLQIAASLGAGGGIRVADDRVLIALLAAIALCGPTIVLLVATTRRHTLRHAAGGALIRVALLRQLATGVIIYGILIATVTALERPRGAASTAQPGAKNLTAQAVGSRAERAAAQALAAGSAGFPTEALAEKGATDGTKLALVLLLLVGGGTASATGGLRWPLVAGIFCAYRRNRKNYEPRNAAQVPINDPRVPGDGDPSMSDRDHAPAVARRVLAALAVLLLGVIFALLILDAIVATRYSSPATLADATLDAGAAVLGGGVSGGVTATVTNRNLSAGIQQPTDLYQYGMVLLAAAMVVGRVAPLWQMNRVAARADRP